MRTHYGMAGVECMTCTKPHQFLLLPRHAVEGVRHHQCGGVAATAVTAKRLIAAVEERERVHGSPWSGLEAEALANGLGQMGVDVGAPEGDRTERSLLLGSEDSGVMGFRASEGGTNVGE